ncbi:MAG: cytochrome ubiquinol oxidase subunit I [Candidatus Limnocylindrales bacterium]
MSTLDLSRWQFGITTVYHFLFVPLTIGLAFLVAGFQTAWVRTNKDRYLQLTRFYGDLFLINFALGVVTGIVQEFQFGMNWSAYSRFVGDIFGAPLAIEGLLAFFLESTFLGLWIFGWDRLPKRVHLATIWLAAIGTVLSAYFILIANAWMQDPVGYQLNAAAGRAELTNFLAVLTSSVAVITFLHTVAAAVLTAGAFVAGVALWRLWRHPDLDADVFRTAARVGAWTVLVAVVLVFVTGDQQGKVITTVQPMKTAAAEALYHTSQPASFSIFTIGSPDGRTELFSVRIPDVLSFLATGNLNGTVEGINNLQAQYAATYGPGDYVPYVPVIYWTFRLMIGMGVFAALGALWILWAVRRRGVPIGRWVLAVALILPLLPLAANSVGWLCTEMGRQPWLVFGLMQTQAGVSPGTSTAEVLISLVGFTVLYGGLAVVEVRLLAHRIGQGMSRLAPDDEGTGADNPFGFGY